MAVDHRHWAEYLLDATERRVEADAITASIPDLSAEDAYAIQAAGLDLRLDRGETIAGVKLGLTSKAKQEQMNVDEPVYGYVTERAVIDGTDVDVGELIHPRCEPEFVFLVGDAIEGDNVTAGDVLDATTSVVGGIEVIDSRFKAFSFTLPDVIADNTSAGRVVLGCEGAEPRGVDLSDVSCTFTVDGEVTGTSTGAALLGDPAECVAMLARHLSRYGQRIEAGWFVLAGAPTDARPLGVGTVAEASYSHFGSVTAKGS